MGTLTELAIDRRIIALDGIDVKGKRVLDIGGYHGQMAAYALAIGASQAIVLDNLQYRLYRWDDPVHLPGVDYVTGDFHDWSEPVDVVLFLNVLYHVPSPWHALQHLRGITREVLSLQCPIEPGEEPTWRLNHAGDPNYFFRPTLSGLRLLLERVGFKKMRVVGPAGGDHMQIQAW